jgi:Mycothiol maleylpyruvate isomerase N-terminal domain
MLGVIADSSAAWRAPVPACPGWTVRDVVAHLTAVAEEWGDGTLAGPPTDAGTAAQIARFGGEDNDGVVAVWTTAAERLDQQAETAGVTPPLGDITCHEHDIRAALSTPGARDSQAVWWTSDQLLTKLRTPVPLRVIVEDGQYSSNSGPGNEICLRTTRFEALRWRTGRRSRAQLQAMDWSEDPHAVLEHLHLFGPADVDVVE